MSMSADMYSGIVIIRIERSSWIGFTLDTAMASSSNWWNQYAKKMDVFIAQKKSSSAKSNT